MVSFQILKKIKELRLVWFLFLLIFSFCFFVSPTTLLARGIKFKPGLNSTTISFHNSNGLIIVPFKIGNVSVNLILDSGVRGILLFDKAGSYGLKSKPGLEIAFSGIGKGTEVKGKLISEVKLDAPGIVGTGLAVVLIPDNTLPKNFDTEVNGLIGYDIFSKFLVTIDYKSSKLTLSEPKNFNSGNSFQQMDLILSGTKPYIKSNITSDDFEGVYTFFIDTGASFDLILNNNPFKEKNKNRKGIIGIGLTGNVKGKHHLMKDFYFSNFYLNNFSIAIPTSGVYLNQELMHDRDGTLGGKFLQRFEVVVFDYSNNKVYFKTNELMALKEK